ncbi:hypothetical protein EC957_007690 [Mortierella hygrophila]|uniref:Uncharacterized protein n=1 Tax=Mortierella hygrophila TaxID=979708 RepID=A0A9P6JY95_9FUNG|nr:hypothetical protein EC957_007690 [Mortierella hygrophila]
MLFARPVTYSPQRAWIPHHELPARRQRFPFRRQSPRMGPKNGYVYQKAYLEVFVSPENLNELVSRIE